MPEPDSIRINEVEYVRKVTPDTEKYPYVICRTQSAGVFAGHLIERNGQEVTLYNARRLWYWSGAASLSEAAVQGFKKPFECKFPVGVPEVKLLQAIEILYCTEKGKTSIEMVPVWSA